MNTNKRGKFNSEVVMVSLYLLQETNAFSMRMESINDNDDGDDDDDDDETTTMMTMMMMISHHFSFSIFVLVLIVSKRIDEVSIK